MAAGVQALGLRGARALQEMLEQSELRYEVIDGCVVVSPSARFGHEDLAAGILTTLRNACPHGLTVLGSNYGVHYIGPEDERGDVAGSFFLPDVQVVAADSPELRNRTAPALVVEILSPSTRWKDLGRKREVYAAIGVPSYWVVDPEARELFVLSLHGDSFVETARGRRLELTVPFPVTIDLVPERDPGLSR